MAIGQLKFDDMSNLSTLPKGDSAWLLRKAIERIIQQVSVLETNIGSSTTGNSADGQVIFNDAGVLRGDTGLTFAPSTDTLRAGLLIVPGNTQLATVGTLYVGSISTPKLKVDVAGTGITTITEATITGALTVDTTTLVVDATNDRVGIGTASPIAGSRLDVRSAVGTGTDIQSLTVVDTSPLAINNGGGLSMGYVFYAPNTVIGRAGYIKTIKENATDGNYASAMVFGVTANGVATAERMRLDSTGNINVTSGNVVMATSGKGIDFSATADGAGRTSELLADYEEGTWTPTVFGSTGAGVGVYSAQGGFYTKVGNIVTVQAYLIWSALAGATGDLRFGGLPFAASASTNAISAASIGYANNITLTASNVLTIFNSGTNTFVQAYQYPVGGGVSTIVPVALSGGIIYSITYRV